MEFVSHLVRRGVEAHSSYRPARPDGNHEDMPAWAIVGLSITVMVFCFGLFMIQYTYGHLIATLAMVETPTAVVFPTASSDDIDASLEKKDLQQELVIIKQEPLTSSLPRTLMRLCAKGGRLSRFRGFSIWVVYQFFFINLTKLASRILSLPQGVGAVLAVVALARLGTAWTHVVITDPSSKYWFQRAPHAGIWRKVAIPSAIFAISEQLSIELPVYLFRAFDLHHTGAQEFFSEMDNQDRQLLVGKLFAVIAVGLFTKIAIVVPASVCLTRIQASLLPEDQETIVPFDRSFGRLIPKAAWGSSAIDMLDAWKSFDWNSRIRLLKLYAKVIAMQVSLAVFTTVAILVQLYLVIGVDLHNIHRLGNSGAQSEVNAD